METLQEIVQRIYNENLMNGFSKEDAAKDAQKRTGVSIITGVPFRRNNRSLREIGRLKRQYE